MAVIHFELRLKYIISQIDLKYLVNPNLVLKIAVTFKKNTFNSRQI